MIHETLPWLFSYVSRLSLLSRLSLAYDISNLSLLGRLMQPLKLCLAFSLKLLSRVAIGSSSNRV